MRLIGISGANLLTGNAPRQVKLFDEVREKNDNWEKIEQVVDTISEKFGENMVQKAELKSLKDKNTAKPHVE